MTRLQKVLFAGPDDRGQKTDDHAKRRGRQKNQRVAAIVLKTETSFLTFCSCILEIKMLIAKSGGRQEPGRR